MQVQESNSNGVVILAVNGRADSEGVGILEKALEGALYLETYQIVLDLSHLAYINSAGLRILVNALTVCRAQGGNVHLVGINAKIMHIFDIIGLQSFFYNYPDIESAVAAFSHP